MTAHVTSRNFYLMIFGALIALTLLTTGVAYINLGRFSPIVAILIAVTKATLVALYFMHLRTSEQLTKLALLAALFWLVLLIGGTVSDVLTRNWFAGTQGW